MLSSDSADDGEGMSKSTMKLLRHLVRRLRSELDTVYDSIDQLEAELISPDQLQLSAFKKATPEPKVVRITKSQVEAYLNVGDLQ